MITVVAKSIIKAGKKDEYIKLAKELIAETLKEEGCIEYNLYQEASSPNVMSFIERWENQEVLEKHFKTPHFTKLVPMLGEFREGASEVSVYSQV